MKTLIPAFLLASLLVPFAPAQDEDRPRRPGPPPPSAEGGDPLLRLIDRNGDGDLQQFEIDMAVVVLRRMDRDQDGVVSADELRAPPPRFGQGNRPGNQPRPGQGGFPRLGDLDTDKDGRISKDEAPDRMRERFDMIDANSDGFLDKEEQEALIARMRERFRNGGADRRRPEPEAPGGGVRPKRPPLAD